MTKLNVSDYGSNLIIESENEDESMTIYSEHFLPYFEEFFDEFDVRGYIKEYVSYIDTCLDKDELEEIIFDSSMRYYLEDSFAQWEKDKENL